MISLSSKYKKEKGFYHLSPVSQEFSDLYIKARDIEQRVYSDETLKSLPHLPYDHPQKKEWDMRVKSTNRFLKFLSKKENKPSLLEIGCGNGWFSNKCSNYSSSVLGIDINPVELEQASKVFQSENIEFAYWNVFEKIDLDIRFDIIVINASIQYFQDISELVKTLTKRLNPAGEIHILDSPFYESTKVLSAKQRTKNYYSGIGVDEMSEFYFHHSKEAVSQFKILYNSLKNKWIKRILKDIPFGWYMKKLMIP